jgi:hypothetical protein
MNIDIRLNDFALPINVIRDSNYYCHLCKMFDKRNCAILQSCIAHGFLEICD